MAMKKCLLSFNEASQMVNEPYTSYKALKYKKHLSLLPKYINSISRGINDILNNELDLYSAQLDGVPIAFGKAKTFQSLAYIMDESPHMHFNIEVDCVLFQPKEGDILQGIVNKLAADHIGCLVHGKFNVSIHQNQDKQKHWVGNVLEGGETIQFEVTKIITKELVSIYGKLTKSCVDKMLSSKSKGRKRKRENSNANDSGVDMNSPEIGQECKSNSYTVAKSAADACSETESPVKKKRKKKKHDKKH